MTVIIIIITCCLFLLASVCREMTEADTLVAIKTTSVSRGSGEELLQTHSLGAPSKWLKWWWKQEEANGDAEQGEETMFYRSFYRYRLTVAGNSVHFIEHIKHQIELKGHAGQLGQWKRRSGIIIIPSLSSTIWANIYPLVFIRTNRSKCKSGSTHLCKQGQVKLFSHFLSTKYVRALNLSLFC